MEIGIEDLPLAQAGDFFRLRLLYLHHHVARFEDRCRTVDNRCTRFAVVGVESADPFARAAFDQYFVTVPGQLFRALRRQADAVFAILDLARTSDTHDSLLRPISYD